MKIITRYGLLLAPLMAILGVSDVNSQIVTGVQDFSITVQQPVDLTPDSFTFTSVNSAQPNTLTQSAILTITGIDGDVPISISGGQYSRNAAAYTSTPGIIRNGETVRVQLTSSAAFSTAASATLTIGTVSRTFTVTTRVAGACEVAGTTLGTLCGDGTVYVGNYSGKRYFMNTARPTGTWSDSNTNVRAQTSSSSGLTNTQGMRSISPTLSFFNGAEYCNNTFGSSYFLPSTDEINAIWNNLSVSDRTSYFLGNSYHMTSEEWGSGKFGQNVSTSFGFYYVLIPSSDFLTNTWTGRGKAYASVIKCVRTDTLVVPDDFTPDAFTFTAQSNVMPSTSVNSNSVTISGIVGNAPISISGSGATYSVNGGSFISGASTITNGSTVRVNLTSSSNPSTSTSATLTVGTMSRTFTVTTPMADTTPDAFSFAAQTDVQPATAVTSNSVTISGLVGSATVSVSGGASYSINGGAFTSTSGPIGNGQTLQVRMTSSSTLGATMTGDVTVGTVTRSFSVTTTAQDTTPNAFAFSTSENRTSAQPSTLVTFNPVTISGLSTSVPVSVSGEGSPSIRINGGAWASSGTVSNGDTVAVRMTSSASFSTTLSTTVTVGNGSAAVSVITRPADTTPDYYSASDLSNAERNAYYTKQIQMTGFDTTLVSASNATVSVDGSNFFSSVRVNAGQTLFVRARASSAPSGVTSVVITTDLGGPGQGTYPIYLTTRSDAEEIWSLSTGSSGTVDGVPVKKFSSRVAYVGLTDQTWANAVAQCNALGAGWSLPPFSVATGSDSMNVHRSAIFGVISKRIWNSETYGNTQLATISITYTGTSSSLYDVACIKSDPNDSLYLPWP